MRSSICRASLTESEKSAIPHCIMPITRRASSNRVFLSRVVAPGQAIAIVSASCDSRRGVDKDQITNQACTHILEKLENHVAKESQPSAFIAKVACSSAGTDAYMGGSKTRRPPPPPRPVIVARVCRKKRSSCVGGTEKKEGDGTSRGNVAMLP